MPQWERLTAYDFFLLRGWRCQRPMLLAPSGDTLIVFLTSKWSHYHMYLINSADTVAQESLNSLEIRAFDSPLSSEDTKYTLCIGWNFRFSSREFKLYRPESAVLRTIFSYIRLVLNLTASINYSYYYHDRWVSSNENIPLTRCNIPSVTPVMDEMLQLRATPATWKFGFRRNWNFVKRKIVFLYERWILIEF